MRIGLVTGDFWPNVGGAEMMIRRLATEFAAKRHEVTVITRRWDRQLPATEHMDGFQIIRVPASEGGKLRITWNLARLAYWVWRRRQWFDLMYVSMLKHTAFASIIPWKVLAGNLILLRAEGAGATGDIAWQNEQKYGKLIRKYCKKADAVVAPSRAIREELVGAGYDPEKVYPIANAVPVPSEPWQADQTTAKRRELNLPERTTLCYTGRLHEGKGLTDLIKAFAKLSNDHGLVIVGDGPESAPLEVLTGELGVRERVVFTGRVDDVEPYLRASELFVLPSYHEGLSVALLEALAIGMPTIASDIPGNRDVVEADLMPLFPVREPEALAGAIQAALASEASTASRVKAQRVAVRETYAIEAVAELHLALFRELVAAPSK